MKRPCILQEPQIGVVYNLDDEFQQNIDENGKLLRDSKEIEYYLFMTKCTRTRTQKFIHTISGSTKELVNEGLREIAQRSDVKLISILDGVKESKIMAKSTARKTLKNPGFADTVFVKWIDTSDAPYREVSDDIAETAELGEDVIVAEYKLVTVHKVHTAVNATSAKGSS